MWQRFLSSSERDLLWNSVAFCERIVKKNDSAALWETMTSQGNPYLSRQLLNCSKCYHEKPEYHERNNGGSMKFLSLRLCLKWIWNFVAHSCEISLRENEAITISVCPGEPGELSQITVKRAFWSWINHSRALLLGRGTELQVGVRESEPSWVNSAWKSYIWQTGWSVCHVATAMGNECKLMIIFFAGACISKHLGYLSPKGFMCESLVIIIVSEVLI